MRLGKNVGGWFVTAAAVVAAAGFAGAQGCTVLTNDAALDDAGTYEGGGEGGSNACNECLFPQCTGQSATCVDSADCLAIVACASAPGCDAACQSACICGAAPAGAHPGGQAAYVAYSTCNNFYSCGPNACADPCASTSPSCQAPGSQPANLCGDGGADASSDAAPDDASSDASSDATSDAGSDASDAGDSGDATAPPAVGVSACNSCIDGKCGSPKKACAQGSQCDDYVQCSLGCRDQGCVNSCGAAHATGKAAAHELSQCVVTNCPAPCGF